MYFIVVNFPIKPEYADQWPELTRAFTEATRAEEGNLWFDWSRSLDDPHEYVLVEAFTDDGAGPHVQSDHFATAVSELPQYLAATPRIVSRQVDGSGWDEMGEMRIE